MRRSRLHLRSLTPVHASRFPRRKDRAIALAFTLIELLVVMGVIAILAAITLGAAGYVNRKAAASRAQAEIAAMEAALERYKVDNGIYPLVAAPGSYTNSNGALPTFNPSGFSSTAQALYTNLSGKLTYSAAATAPTYMEFKAGQLSTNGSPNYVQDPFGYPYCYVSSNAFFNAGFFDLWSTGGQTGTSPSTNSSQWITNWKGN